MGCRTNVLRVVFLRNQGDEWVFRMEMPAIFHKFIVGSRVWDLKVINEKNLVYK